MSDTLTSTDYDRELIKRAFEQSGANCGLSPDDMRNLVRAESQFDGKVELQFIELVEHLTALVGSSAEVQSNWFRTENLDLGEAPLSIIKAPDGIGRVRDYLAGQRHKS